MVVPVLPRRTVRCRNVVSTCSSSIERKEADLLQTLGHRLQASEQMVTTYETLMNEVSDYATWLKETELALSKRQPTGASVVEAEGALQDHFVSIVPLHHDILEL